MSVKTLQSFREGLPDTRDKSKRVIEYNCSVQEGIRVDGRLLMEQLDSDFQKTLQPPHGKSDRVFVPPEIIKLIVEKVVVSIIGGLSMQAGGAVSNWWKNRGKDLNDVKGRPTPELAAQSRALLDEAETQIREELAKTSPQQLKAPDRAELTREIRAILADFHFSDTEA